MAINKKSKKSKRRARGKTQKKTILKYLLDREVGLKRKIKPKYFQYPPQCNRITCNNRRNLGVTGASIRRRPKFKF